MRNGILKKVALLIDTAYKSGGNIQESIEIVNHFTQEFQSQQRKRKNELKPHIFVVYISFIIFIALGFILITQFFSMEQTTVSIQANLSRINTNFFNPDIDFANLFYRISIVEGFFSGLVVGEISSGTIKAGFIHAAILCIISFLAFNLLV